MLQIEEPPQFSYSLHCFPEHIIRINPTSFMHLTLQTYKEFFPNVAVGYQDPRVHVHIADGKKLSHLLLIHNHINHSL